MVNAVRSAAVFVVAALIGLVLALAQTASANGVHYQNADWSVNPNAYMNSNMSYPLNNYESRVFVGDDPWDAVSGANLNILVWGTTWFAHSGSATSITPEQWGVPAGEITITDAYWACSSNCVLARTSVGVYGHQPWEIKHVLMRINEDNDINWAPPGNSSGCCSVIDFDTVYIHEMGHAVGFHDFEDTSDKVDPDCGLTSTSNQTVYSGQLTMCGVYMKWSPGTWRPFYGRTLTWHEANDHATNY